MLIRRHIEVTGIVQGVGFRPYIYRLATERNLAGTIRNTSSGVTIEVQGSPAAVNDFVSRLPEDSPPLARITGISFTDLPCEEDRDFRIVASHGEEAVRTLISPDVATCDDCLREMFAPGDRRYRYPFINCTNCGPRFTITHSIPYDRPSTSMALFKMCPACRAEYDDPRNRRFHAQPNACWECGPQLKWWDCKGLRLSDRDPVAAAIGALQAGKIVAVKGLGGFHLSADATSDAAVALLHERKRRIGKPFAIMVPDLAAAERLCEVSGTEARLLLSMQRPIVLLRRREGEGARTSAIARKATIAEDVAPGNTYLGVFLPYTPLHHLIFREGGFAALVMTSGNLSEEPIAIANDEARRRLAGIADFFLVHDRDILLRCDDSVARVLEIPSASSVNGPRTPRSKAANRKDRDDGTKSAMKDRGDSGEPHGSDEVTRVQQLRRSRGFVPVPVFLRDEVFSVLAVGGELKNTVCLTKGKYAFLSQHVGDLENVESYEFFEEAIEHLERVLEIEPKIVAYDLHPDYFSTRWALQQSAMPVVGVQHHHAHIASCMAENHLEDRVIGFALDGTGYGTDGRIWGGEVLIAGYKDFERAAHFEYVPLPGGAAAIREPWRMAVSYLEHHFGGDFRKIKLPFLNGISSPKLELILRTLERKVNSPLTSSCGRLFDAVAAMAGVRQQVSFEAQAAIELEMAIEAGGNDAAYHFQLAREDGAMIIRTRPMFETLVEDVVSRTPTSEISRKFHNGLVNIFVQIAETLRDRTLLNRVCLSGGTFNNLYLTTNLVAALTAAEFEVFTQNELPAGDGGLSLGQALVAAHRTNATPQPA
jgi:hydrogenase maturation protein HypF